MKEVNISVEGPAVIIRHIELPKMKEDELKKAIKFEAEKYIPYGVKDVVLDCQILRELKNGMAVLLVAVKKDFINNRIKLVQKAGLRPWVVDVDSFALINAFSLNYPQKKGTIALLNVGASMTHVNILKDGTLSFTRNNALGGNEITKLISERLNIKKEEAETLKRKPADKKDELFEISSTVFKELTNEIKSSFDYYESQYEEGVSEIYISGGVAQCEEFKNFLSQNLEINIQSWDPLKNINISSKFSKEQLKGMSYFLPVAIGLALRKI